MSFQAYLNTIKDKSGRDPEGLREWPGPRACLKTTA